MKSLRFNAIATAAALLMTLAVGACGEEEGDSPLPAPATVTTSQVSLTSIKIDWAAVTGADSYVLERASAGAPGVFTPIGGSIAGLTYTDATVTAGLAYTYRVAAVDDGETQTYSAGTTFTTGLAQATLTGNIAVSRVLKSDTVYVISGYVKVQNGATLTIEAGTKLVGDSTVGGSSLWILRGAQINATGTAVAPIVFTSQRAAGDRKPGDWGGLIIVGNGIINRSGSPINTEGGAAGQAVDYSGGNDNASNSGTLKYVRIEFAGYDVSGGAGQELNSLSSYAVGRGTTYEYIQTMAGLDDSFEWWGGAVDGRYLISYEAGDDHFDWTEGYVGRNQFLIALQTQRLNPAPGTGVFSSDPKGFEGDGCDPGVSGCTVNATGASTPYSNPVFANFTMIGPGQLAGIPSDGNGATWRRGTAGTFANGVLSRWKGIAINVRDAWTDTLLQAKDSLNIRGILLAQNGFNYDTAAIGFGQVAKFAADSHKVYAANVAVDTLLGISLNPAGLDWTPKAGSPANTGAVAIPAAKVTNYFGGTWANTTYIGAADPVGAKWWQGWTSYSIN